MGIHIFLTYLYGNKTIAFKSVVSCGNNTAAAAKLSYAYSTNSACDKTLCNRMRIGAKNIHSQVE